MNRDAFLEHDPGTWLDTQCEVLFDDEILIPYRISASSVLPYVEKKSREECRGMDPLINDRFTNKPNERILDSIIWKRNIGLPVVGIYCAYAPLELVRAIGAVPACLCAFSRKTIEEAETVLPGNLCPLIKSSFGFIKTDTCPFYALSEAIIGETTCDGKKKMFELIRHIKPTHIMDLPQKPDEPEALFAWTTMVHKLKTFLEQTFGKELTDDSIEFEIRETNRKNRLITIFSNTWSILLLC